MKRLLLNAAVLAGGGKLWDVASMRELLGDTANTHLQKLAKKYNLDITDHKLYDDGLADQLTSVVEAVFAPRSAGAFLLAPDDLNDIPTEDGEPLAFELDAATISEIFNRSLQAAVEPLLRYAAIADLDPGPSFAELQQSLQPLSSTCDLMT